MGNPSPGAVDAREEAARPESEDPQGSVGGKRVEYAVDELKLGNVGDVGKKHVLIICIGVGCLNVMDIMTVTWIALCLEEEGREM